MGTIITGDVVDATDVMTPEQGNAPAPQVQEQQKEAEEKPVEKKAE